MARFGILLSLLFLPTFASLPVRADDRISTTLAVQAALQKGKSHLIQGEFQAAVDVLESQISRIDGSITYLNAMRDAYRGCIKTLKLAGDEEKAATYLRRLQILDPQASVDFTTPKPVVPVAGIKPEAQPVKEPKKPVKEPVARAKIDETPPPRPSAAVLRAQEAQGFVKQGDQHFHSQNYAKAGELYTRANELLPDALGEAKERWGYCKLSFVVERLNEEKQIDSKEWPGLEREVRTAMALMPKLGTYGAKLLSTIENRRDGVKAAREEKPVAVPVAASEVAVKHSQAAGSRWALAETANFRIFHALERTEAEEIARIAEATRVGMQTKWFGKVQPDWSPRCDIYLHANADAYSRETGVPGNSPGHSTLQTEGDRVLTRRVDLRLDNPNLLKGVLPHETTHVVLAGQFGPTPVPRWVDEGIAVLTEPRELIDRHVKNLPAHRRDNLLLSVRQLMELNDYPHPRQVGAFYGQSVTLVEYLSQLKGPQTFTQFMRDGLQGGYEPALKRHFGIQGYNELQSRWMAHAFRDVPGAGIAQGE